MNKLSLNKINEEEFQGRYRKFNYQIGILNKISNEIRYQQFPHQKHIPHIVEKKPKLKQQITYIPLYQLFPIKNSKRILRQKTSDNEVINYENSQRQIQQYLEQEQKQLQSEQHISSLLRQRFNKSFYTESYQIQNNNNRILTPTIYLANDNNDNKYSQLERRRSKSYHVFESIEKQDVMPNSTIQLKHQEKEISNLPICYKKQQIQQKKEKYENYEDNKIRQTRIRIIKKIKNATSKILNQTLPQQNSDSLRQIQQKLLNHNELNLETKELLKESFRDILKLYY